MHELDRSGDQPEVKTAQELERLLLQSWEAGSDQITALSDELATCQRRVQDFERSLSWRLTSPLRRAKRELARGGRS